MRIVHLSDEAYAAIKDTEFPTSEKRMEAYRSAAKSIQDGLNAPIDLGSCSKVAYDSRKEVYIAHFGISTKKMELKATNAVATFLAEHMHEHGSWRGQMGVSTESGKAESGYLVEVYLMQA